MADNRLLNTIRALPKIELHRHLEGSVRLETLVHIARDYDIEMPEYDVELVRPFVQMMPGETRNSQHFLAKFATLRQFFRSPDVIKQVAREVIADAAADNIKYIELRMTPPALASVIKCSFHEVVEWVLGAMDEACREHDVQANLILALNRHESLEVGEKVLQAALDFQGQGVVAIDLCGNENEYPAAPFAPLFRKAKAAGLGITIHAGEWAGADNIREAIDMLGAQRIGHGVRAIEDPTLVEWLAERQIVLEVCPTSNIHSGVVGDWDLHPLPGLYRQQVRTTINTDDPLVSNITLSDELVRAVTSLTFTLDEVKAQMLTAAQAAFLPEDRRTALAGQLAGWPEAN